MSTEATLIQTIVNAIIAPFSGGRRSFARREAEKECLSQDDLRLFHKGACHIFAVALTTEFPCEGYSIKHVVIKRKFDIVEAYHVLAALDQFLVDASGIRRADDYIAWLTARHFDESSEFVPSIELRDVATEELTAHFRDDPRLGSVNRWSLFVGTEFVEEARKRAVKLINHWPQKYQVSVLQTGLTIAN